MQNLIDGLVEPFQINKFCRSSIILSACAIFAATILGNLLNALYDYRLFTFVTKLEDELRFMAYQKYLSLHALYHHEVNSGQIIGRIDRGAGGVYEILRDIIGKFILQPAFTLLVIAGVLFWKDPTIAILVIAPLPIFILIVVPLANRIYLKEKKAHDIFENFNREEYDVAANVMTVKNFAQEDRETAKQKVMRAAGREFQYEAERYWVSELCRRLFPLWDALRL